MTFIIKLEFIMYQHLAFVHNAASITFGMCDWSQKYY